MSERIKPEEDSPENPFQIYWSCPEWYFTQLSQWSKRFSKLKPDNLSSFLNGQKIKFTEKGYSAEELKELYLNDRDTFNHLMVGIERYLASEDEERKARLKKFTDEGFKPESAEKHIKEIEENSRKRVKDSLINSLDKWGDDLTKEGIDDSFKDLD